MTFSERKMARASAREILRKAGYEHGRVHALKDLLYSIEVYSGQECQGDQDQFIARFVREHRRAMAPARAAPTFHPLKLSPQMLINMERASAHQPSLITPKGFGNGEGRFGFWPG